MGTFGTGITQDDTVADVIAFVVDRLKAGSPLAVASGEALHRFRELQTDDDESPLLWLALASVQWKYGAVDATVLNRVRADVATGRGLDRWSEDLKLLSKRKGVLAKFLAQVEVPNPKPSPMPRVITRAAPFEAGDCLSVLTSSGRYTAALVLKVDNSRTECGMNLVAGLDYLDAEPPDISVFEQRRWLRKHHGQWNGEPDLAWYLPVRLRQARKHISLVGKIRLRSDDPRESRSHVGWNLLGQQILLCRATSASEEV